MEKKLRYACVGAGGIARKKHMAGYAKMPEIEIAAVCDENLEAARKLAADYNVSHVYSDYLEMLKNENLDIISVCTPNVTHKPITIAALEHGCHVHVEKPVALNEKEALEIIDAEERTGKKVQVGLNKRFLSSTLLIQKLLKEGFFGNIYHVRCGWERNSGIPGVGRWFTDKSLSGGGALIDLGVHYLDLAMCVLDWPEPEQVTGSVSNNFLLEGTRIRKGYKSADGLNDVEDMANGSVIMANGKTLEFCFNWASNIEKEIRYIEAYGTKAGFRIKNTEFRLYTRLGGSMFTLVPDVDTMPADENEFQSFIKCILDDEEPTASTRQAAQVMRLIDQIYSSAHYWKA